MHARYILCKTSLLLSLSHLAAHTPYDNEHLKDYNPTKDV